MFMSRLQSFQNRMAWYKSLTKSSLHAFTHLVLMKFFPEKNFQAFYNGQPFVFTRKDMSALHEVLIEKEYDFLQPLISDQSKLVIVDIGANIGTFSIWSLNINPDAQIFSLEASPKNFSTLIQNQRTHKNAENWECLNRAAWNTDTEIGFKEDGDSMSYKVSNSSDTRVKAMSLPSLLVDINQISKKDYIDIMKIDIEGAEEAFLANTPENKKALQKIKNLVIELHPNYCDSDAVYAFLQECFKNIEEQQDRETRKPLLLCQN